MGSIEPDPIGPRFLAWIEIKKAFPEEMSITLILEEVLELAQRQEEEASRQSKRSVRKH